MFLKRRQQANYETVKMAGIRRLVVLLVFGMVRSLESRPVGLQEGRYLAKFKVLELYFVKFRRYCRVEMFLFVSVVDESRRV